MCLKYGKSQPKRAYKIKKSVFLIPFSSPPPLPPSSYSNQTAKNLIQAVGETINSCYIACSSSTMRRRKSVKKSASEPTNSDTLMQVRPLHTTDNKLLTCKCFSSQTPQGFIKRIPILCKWIHFCWLTFHLQMNSFLRSEHESSFFANELISLPNEFTSLQMHSSLCKWIHVSVMNSNHCKWIHIS